MKITKITSGPSRPRQASPRGILVLIFFSETTYKKFPSLGQSLDFGRSVGSPFGAIMADLGPSRPHHPPKEGFPAPRFSRESSGARLGPDFRSFS